MYQSIILAIVVALFINQASAQEHVCNADELLEHSVSNDAATRSFMDDYLRQINLWLERNYPENPQLHRSPVTIPVVVHVVHKNDTENLSESLIRSQIAALNKLFMKQNTSEINSRGFDYKNRAGKSYVQFRLARRDPNGRATTGINRKRTTNQKFEYNSALDSEKVKRGSMSSSTDGIAAWDTDRYLNIWVCDLWYKKNSSSPSKNLLLGYATFPWDKVKIPGVAMDYTCFGTSGAINPKYREGITCAHEVGHFLGVMHTFQGYCANDDKAADTPPQTAKTFGTPTYPLRPNDCPGSNGTGPHGVMFMNIMDYSDDVARCMFTKDQTKRMVANLAPNGVRASLAVSNALFPPNAATVSHEVFLESQQASLPGWKASLAMITNWAWQQSTDVNAVIRDNASHCAGNRIPRMPTEVSDAICGLALTAEEILTCYSIEGFYDIVRRRPITILSIKNNEYYGLTISGMVMDNRSGTALLSIKDPLNVGPSLGISNRGAAYTVDYGEFMTDILERLVEQNTHSYIIYPPRRRSSGR